MDDIWIGVDEAGVGTLAGPMVVAIVALPKSLRLKGVTDSKKMTDKSREDSIDLIHNNALYYRVSVADAAQVDSEGIWNLWNRLVSAVVTDAQMEFDGHEVLLDGNRVLPGRRLGGIVPIVGGDLSHHCISAASVLAKYTQCCAMDDIHKEFPRYGFNRHRGYGSAQHLNMIKEYGPCPYHRMSYRPLKDLSQ